MNDMHIDRRTFLKLAALGLLAVAAKPALDFISKPSAAAASNSAFTGRRLAMAIDLNACTAGHGCTDCIAACHRVHNVPDIGNVKEEIKWLWEVGYMQAFSDQETEFVRNPRQDSRVLVLCNHCDNPPCVRVCPTQATWKREDGIVMMDYHRCIGCRYCMAACPYGSRSFNWRDPRPYIKVIEDAYPTRTRGVVEKCNFCEERLSDGLQPACVEACRSGALKFGDLKPGTELYDLISSQFNQRRKIELGTRPQVYYLL
jgi:molybdopterin-containing oxidoreductase family iron-sulfur binding subunit